MSSSTSPHPDSEMLLRLVDEDLSAAERQEVDRHVQGCEECAQQVEALRETLGDYLKFHEAVLKPSLAAPPQEWERLALRPRVLRFPSKRWLAAAAAIVMAVFLMRRLEHAPAVSAAVLLDKATVAERSAPVTKGRIRIRTRNHTWNRNRTGDTSPDLAEAQKLFAAAGYNWQNPLSAEAFAEWRGHLAEKRDEVTLLPKPEHVESYVIRTFASGGALSDASLTLRARDLHAVACTLRFRSDETIDMAEVSDQETAAPSAEQPAAAPPVVELPAARSAAQEAGPAEELRVIAALHRIGADLGEPVEVRREGSGVLVSATGLDPQRQEQVRTALAAVPGVQVQLNSVPRTETHAGLQPRRSAPAADRANPVISELQASLGRETSPTELADQFIDRTDASIERAYALRALARRFPPEVTRQWDAANAQILREILRDHVEKLATSVQAIRNLLAPILPQKPTANSSHADWQSYAEAVLVSVQQMDQALNAGSSESEEIGARKARLAQALADLDQEMAGLRHLVEP